MSLVHRLLFSVLSVAEHEGGSVRRASDLYDELTRVRSLLQFYNLYPFGSSEDRATFEVLSDILGRRERDILKQLANLQAEDESD